MRWLITYLALLAIAAGLVWFHLSSRGREGLRERTERVSKRIFPHGEEMDADPLHDAVTEVVIDHGPDGERIVARRREDAGEGTDWRIIPGGEGNSPDLRRGRIVSD